MMVSRSYNGRIKGGQLVERRDNVGAFLLVIFVCSVVFS